MPTTLLAVDDSVTMRKVLEMTFAGEHDLRVVTADGVDSALVKFRNERAVVVLADLSLDGPGGYGLCTRIKAESSATPVIILSSKQQPYDAAKGQAVRADDFIEKPFDTQQLIDKVRKLLSRVVGEPARPATAPQAVHTPAARSAYASTLVGQPIRQPVPPTSQGTRPVGPAGAAGSAAGAAPPTARTAVAPLAPTAAPVPAPARFGQGAAASPHASASPASSAPTGITSSGLGPGGASATAGAGGHEAPAPPYRAPAPSTAGSLGRGVGAPGGLAASALNAAPAAASATSSAAGRREPTPAPPQAGPAAAGTTAAATTAAMIGAAASTATGANGGLAGRLTDFGLTEAQVTAVLALSRDVVERVVWEVVPVLAETMIREEIKRLTSEP